MFNGASCNEPARRVAVTSIVSIPLSELCAKTDGIGANVAETANAIDVCFVRKRLVIAMYVFLFL